jgi:hypothetical protein
MRVESRPGLAVGIGVAVALTAGRASRRPR